MAAPAGVVLTEAPDYHRLRAVKNAGSSAIAKGLIVKGDETAVALPTATTDVCYGVVYEEIEASGYGTLALGGRVTCTAGTDGVTKGDRIMAEANTGKGITWTASSGTNANVIGIAQTTAAANEDFTIELSGPGITAQG